MGADMDEVYKKLKPHGKPRGKPPIKLIDAEAPEDLTDSARYAKEDAELKKHIPVLHAMGRGATFVREKASDFLKYTRSKTKRGALKVMGKIGEKYDQGKLSFTEWKSRRAAAAAAAREAAPREAVAREAVARRAAAAEEEEEEEEEVAAADVIEHPPAGRIRSRAAAAAAGLERATAWVARQRAERVASAAAAAAAAAAREAVVERAAAAAAGLIRAPNQATRKKRSADLRPLLESRSPSLTGTPVPVSHVVVAPAAAAVSVKSGTVAAPAPKTPSVKGAKAAAAAPAAPAPKSPSKLGAAAPASGWVAVFPPSPKTDSGKGAKAAAAAAAPAPKSPKPAPSAGPKLGAPSTALLPLPNLPGLRGNHKAPVILAPRVTPPASPKTGKAAPAKSPSNLREAYIGMQPSVGTHMLRFPLPPNVSPDKRDHPIPLPHQSPKLQQNSSPRPSPKAKGWDAPLPIWLIQPVESEAKFKLPSLRAASFKAPIVEQNHDWGAQPNNNPWNPAAAAVQISDLDWGGPSPVAAPRGDQSDNPWNVDAVAEQPLAGVGWNAPSPASASEFPGVVDLGKPRKRRNRKPKIADVIEEQDPLSIALHEASLREEKKKNIR